MKTIQIDQSEFDTDCGESKQSPKFSNVRERIPALNPGSAFDENRDKNSEQRKQKKLN